MTAEQDIAAIADGGDNPPSRVRTALTSVLNSGMKLIEEIELGADASTLQFDSIPATFSDLRLSGQLRSTRAASTIDELNLRLATGGGAIDTGANYNSVGIRTNSSGTFAVDARQGATSAQVARFTLPGASIAANFYGYWICEMPQYANTNMFTTFTARSGQANQNADSNANSDGVATGSWENTGAITSVNIFFTNGDIASGSIVRLYGIGP